MKLNPVTASTLSAALIVCLTSCAANKVSETSSSSASGDKSGQTAPGAEKQTTEAGKTGDKGTANDGIFSSALDDIPQLKGLQKLNLAKLPENMTICTVEGTPITVNSFKKEYVNAVTSLQGMLSMQPEKVQEFCSRAKEMKVALSDDEKKRILTTAHSPAALEGKKFEDFLKEKKISAADFESQVLNLGLAFKVGTKIIESQLLSEMINRTLLLKEATQKGFYQKALNDYVKIKETPEFKKLVASSAESPTEIKDEYIEGAEMKMLITDLASKVKISDQALRAEYEKDKARLGHGEKIKLSHIVIAMPTVDGGPGSPLQSVRTQIKLQNPKISEADLDKEEKAFKDDALKRAQEILAKAKAGEDFKTLADHYTEDMPARAAKNGGDLGYVDIGKQIGPDQLKIVSAVSNLKPGQIAPDLVQTNFGYHIVKLTDKQAAGVTPFEEVKGPLRDYMAQQELQNSQRQWIDQRRRNAQIVLSAESTRAIASSAAKSGSETN